MKLVKTAKKIEETDTPSSNKINQLLGILNRRTGSASVSGKSYNDKNEDTKQFNQTASKLFSKNGSKYQSNKDFRSNDKLQKEPIDTNKLKSIYKEASLGNWSFGIGPEVKSQTPVTINNSNFTSKSYKNESSSIVHHQLNQFTTSNRLDSILKKGLQDYGKEDSEFTNRKYKPANKKDNLSQSANARPGTRSNEVSPNNFLIPEIIITPTQQNRKRRSSTKSTDVLKVQKSLDKSLKNDLQLSGVMDKLDLGNINLSPMKQDIEKLYGTSRIKEELDELRGKFKAAASGNSLSAELYQNFLKATENNFRLLDDNHKLNQLNLDLNKNIYSLTLEVDDSNSKLGLFLEFQKNNREMKDQISQLNQNESKLKVEIQDLKMRLRKANEELEGESKSMLASKTEHQRDYDRLLKDYNDQLGKYKRQESELRSQISQSVMKESRYVEHTETHIERL